MAGIGFIIFSLTTNVVVFYRFYLAITLGTAAATRLSLYSVLNRWFIRSRVTAI